MSRSQVSIRIDRDKKEQLVAIAKSEGKTYAQLIRELIENSVLNITTDEQRERILKIIKELREPFAYVKNERGRAHAKTERKLRDNVADRLERVFNLK